MPPVRVYGLSTVCQALSLYPTGRGGSGMGIRWAGVSSSSTVINQTQAFPGHGTGASALHGAPSVGPSKGGPSERSSPCSGGCAQVSGLAGSEALLFLVVPGAAHTPLLGCPTEGHGKHWVRRQGMGLGWHSGTLERLTEALGRGVDRAVF